MILLFPDGRLPSRRWCPLAWLVSVVVLDRDKGLILWYVVSKYCCVEPVSSLYISAEGVDDIDFAWDHDRNLVRAALEDGG
jgi:hypothetical protein